MLRDNLADSFYPYLENPRPTRPDPSLTEYVISPFQAEPAQKLHTRTGFTNGAVNTARFKILKRVP